MSLRTKALNNDYMTRKQIWKLYVCTYAWMYVCMYVWMQVHGSVYVCMYVCMYACIYWSVYVLVCISEVYEHTTTTKLKRSLCVYFWLRLSGSSELQYVTTTQMAVCTITWLSTCQVMTAWSMYMCAHMYTCKPGHWWHVICIWCRKELS